jgi:hypothetical protein
VCEVESAQVRPADFLDLYAAHTGRGVSDQQR